jgi:hypothetical protein
MANLAGDQRELALALSYLARIAEGQGNLAEARDLARRGIAAARAAGDALPLTDSLLQLGHVSIRRRDYATAAPALHEALDVSERIGHSGYITSLNRELAYLALEQRDLPLARARIPPSLETARASSNGANVAELLLSERFDLALAPRTSYPQGFKPEPYDASRCALRSAKPTGWRAASVSVSRR